ncbi:hypothetical protein [Nocardia sp. NPDC059691]|uniref:hypothetical protein n=1 Tax=Nocardia sp. NPDC059691 TaxID=3346908 RepID=UPI003699FC8F
MTVVVVLNLRFWMVRSDHHKSDLYIASVAVGGDWFVTCHGSWLTLVKLMHRIRFDLPVLEYAAAPRRAY